MLRHIIADKTFAEAFFRNHDSPMVREANAFCVNAHGCIDQRRKYTGEPYSVHPIAVARIVACVTPHEAAISAALLHDVAEDTHFNRVSIERRFGEDVAALVDAVTDRSRPQDGNRAARKAIDLDWLCRASSDAQTIKLADLIHNTLSITRYDPSFAHVYMREKRDLVMAMERGDAKLHDLASRMVSLFENGGDPAEVIQSV